MVTNSAVAYDGAIMTLRVDEVAMPGGRTATREVIEHHGAVAIAAVDDQGRVALISQYRHPVGRRLWELPAGLLDGGPDEPPTAAAARELLEETGLVADEWSVLVDVDSSPGFTDESVRVYRASGLRTEERPEAVDEEADLELHWWELDTAVDAVLGGGIVNGTAVAGILALAAVTARGGQPRRADAAWPDRPRALEQRRSRQR
ncbi:NUDIX domain-containing protein [Williamsia sterculiae]|nr:NUDIX hydrolase [Williamsia sterculiae]